MKHIFVFDGDKMTKQELEELLQHNGCVGWISLYKRSKEGIIEDIKNVTGIELESTK